MVAESAEFVVPPNWDTTWNETQVGHAAGAVREYLAEVQTTLLKRLWDALTLSATLPAIEIAHQTRSLCSWRPLSIPDARSARSLTIWSEFNPTSESHALITSRESIQSAWLSL